MIPSAWRATRCAAPLGLSLLLAACGGSPGSPTPSSSPSATPFPPLPDVGFSLLHAAGSRVVNEAGETVLLRGVNLGGWLVKEGYILHLPGEALDAPSEIDRAILDLAGPSAGRQLLVDWQEQWITSADLAEIRALGFNSVRLPLHHALFWDETRGAPRQEGFAFLDRVVTWCAQHRLWLFLDLHCAAGGQNAGNISDSDGVARLFTNGANRDATVALWEAIATRYRGRPEIGGYDLLNEPVWPNGVEVNAFLERVARAVRRADSRHLIVLEGNSWASDFSIFGAPIEGNLMYSFHKYWNATDEASIAAYLEYQRSWNVPLWLGETGENDNAWYGATLDLVRRKEIGWCFWPWKKVWTDNCPLSVEPPAGSWELVTEYYEGKRPRPSPEVAAAAVRALLQAAQPSRCKRNSSVIGILQAH
jgi:endoglucanase